MPSIVKTVKRNLGKFVPKGLKKRYGHSRRSRSFKLPKLW